MIKAKWAVLLLLPVSLPGCGTPTAAPQPPFSLEEKGDLMLGSLMPDGYVSATPHRARTIVDLEKYGRPVRYYFDNEGWRHLVQKDELGNEYILSMTDRQTLYEPLSEALVLYRNPDGAFQSAADVADNFAMAKRDMEAVRDKLDPAKMDLCTASLKGDPAEIVSTKVMSDYEIDEAYSKRFPRSGVRVQAKVATMRKSGVAVPGHVMCLFTVADGEPVLRTARDASH